MIGQAFTAAKERYLTTAILVIMTTSVLAGNVVWYDGEHPVTYQVQGKVAPVVEQALQMFADDMELVTRHKAVPAKDAPIRIVQGKGSGGGRRP